jgi:hypothetical protein
MLQIPRSAAIARLVSLYPTAAQLTVQRGNRDTEIFGRLPSREFSRDLDKCVHRGGITPGAGGVGAVGIISASPSGRGLNPSISRTSFRVRIPDVTAI